jgi:hypothetical protein
VAAIDRAIELADDRMYRHKESRLGGLSSRAAR